MAAWVTESSGTLDLNESTEKYSRASDHLHINKFWSANQGDFQRLASVIEGMVRGGPQIIERRRACRF